MKNIQIALTLYLCFSLFSGPLLTIAKADENAENIAKCESMENNIPQASRSRSTKPIEDEFCANSRRSPIDTLAIENFSGTSKCAGIYQAMKQRAAVAQANQNYCAQLKTNLTQKRNGILNSNEKAADLRQKSIEGTNNMIFEAKKVRELVYKIGQQNITVANGSSSVDYRTAFDSNPMLQKAYAFTANQYQTKNFSQGDNPNKSALESTISGGKDIPTKVLAEQILAASEGAKFLKEMDSFVFSLENANQTIAQQGNGPINNPPPSNPPNTERAPTSSTKDSSSLSGFMNPSTLMGLASLGASLAPLFMKQDTAATPNAAAEKPALQTSSLSSSGKSNNGAGFSQPTTPETKIEANAKSIPNSAEFDLSKSNISDKSLPLAANSSGGSSLGGTKASETAGAAGGSGATPAQHNSEKTDEASKHANNTDDMMSSFGGGGAGALGYSSPPSGDHNSPIKDLLPADMPTGESADLGDGEFEQGSRDLASGENAEVDLAKTADSLFFRVHGTLGRCQKKGCVSSTAGNAAKNLPF